MTEEKHPIPLKSDAPVAAGLWRVCLCGCAVRLRNGPVVPWLQKKADFLDAWIANPVTSVQTTLSGPSLLALDYSRP